MKSRKSRDALAEALASVAVVRADPYAPGAAGELRLALAGRSNLVVARAAEIVTEWELADFAPDVARAFDRFMTDAVRRDPTCAAKIALAEALVRLDHGDEERFGRGVRHVQPEPVWGGTVDTAARLRAVCALGLARANPPDVLLQLATLLADPEPDARTGAARAIAGAGRPGGAPLLWYKVLAGDAEIGPLHECFAALLMLEPEHAPALVARHLDDADPALAEAAALALAASQSDTAAHLLQAAWTATDDPARRAVLLRALATRRDDATFDFLMDLLANGSTTDAGDALAVLAAFGDDRRRQRRIARAAAARPDVSA